MKLAWVAPQWSENMVSEALARLEVIADTYCPQRSIQLAAGVLLEQRKNVQPLLLDRVRAICGVCRQLQGRKRASD
jgi:hypothetical protein